FGGGGGPCAAMRAAPAESIAPATTDAITTPSNGLVIPPPASPGWRRGMKCVVKREAFVFEQLKVRFPVAVEDHGHLPRPHEHLRILDRHVVRNVIAIERREPLDHVQLVAVEVAGAIEPRIFVEIDVVDDERVAFPSAS